MFQWQIVEDTSLPLSSSVPGVTVQPMSHGNAKEQSAGGRGHRPASSWSSQDDDDVGGQYAVVTDSGHVNTAAWLGLSWRFYAFMPRGANTFGCLAYTLAGRRAVRYFTVYKN